MPSRGPDLENKVSVVIINYVSLVVKGKPQSVEQLL
jgi:hypothetical protein